MRADVRVAIAGYHVDEIPDVVVQTVEEDAPKIDVTSQNLSHGHGRIVTGADRRVRTFRVTVGIASTDPVKRQQARERLSVWAGRAKNGAWMEMSSRIGQRIRVITTGFSAVKEQTKLTEMLTVTFESQGEPWWRLMSEVATITNGTAVLVNNGTDEAPLCLNLQAGATATVTLNGKSMVFTGSGTIVLSYDERGIQSIKKNGAAAASCRSEQSEDDLWVQPGTNTITVTGATGTVSVEGRMLS